MASTTEDHDDDHDRGLQFDMSTLLARRRVLSLLAGAGVATLVAACSNGDDAASGGSTAGSAPGSTAGTVPGTTATPTTTSSTATTVTTATAASCDPIPEETAGPFPGDGSNGVNVLAESGVVRSDIRSSFGSSTTVAEGVPLTIELTVADAAACAPLRGAAVYVWHCDRDGNYSMYSDAAADENYLRGVQETDAEGRVTFTSIFPACYQGRWPHVHFEVYASLDEATNGDNAIATSQLAFPADVCDVVYTAAGYEQSVSNLARLSLDSDMVFSDGSSQQVATTTGDVGDGYVAALSLAV